MNTTGMDTSMEAAFGFKFDGFVKSHFFTTEDTENTEKRLYFKLVTSVVSVVNFTFYEAINNLSLDIFRQDRYFSIKRWKHTFVLNDGASFSISGRYPVW